MFSYPFPLYISSLLSLYINLVHHSRVLGIVNWRVLVLAFASYKYNPLFVTWKRPVLPALTVSSLVRRPVIRFRLEVCTTVALIEIAH